MNGFVTTDADSFPLPISFGLACHPASAVARDAGGIRRSRGTVVAFERPAYSSSRNEGVFNAVPEAVVLKKNIFDEDLHAGDEPFRHRGSGKQPQGLDAIGQHGEEGQPTDRVPISHAEVLNIGDLFPTANSLFHSPPANIRQHDSPGPSDAADVLVGEQDHVVGAKAGDDDHKEALGTSGQTHGRVAKVNRAGFGRVGFLVDVRHLDHVGLFEAFGQVAHEDGAVAADDDVASPELTDDPVDAEAI